MGERKTIRGVRRTLRASLWRQLAARFPRRELQRIEGMLDIWVGDRRPRLSANQHQKLLFMPDLPGRPWLDPDEFAFAADFRAMLPKVRRELMALLRRGTKFPLYGEHTAARTWVYAGWREFSMRAGRRRQVANCLQCPRTAELATRTLRAARLQPEFNFLALDPGASLKPHVDAMNFLVTLQMGLVIPEGCGLRVGGVAHDHEEGKLLAFDNSFTHEAWNRSDRLRVVLSVHTAHPLLTGTELKALRFLSPILFQMK